MAVSISPPLPWTELVQRLPDERWGAWVFRYVTLRNIRFSYTRAGRTVSGVVPVGFVCDGMTLPIPSEPLRHLIDGLFFKYWIIHDWVYTRPTVMINGSVRRATQREMDMVFPLPMAALLLLVGRISIEMGAHRRAWDSVRPSSGVYMRQVSQMLRQCYSSKL